MRVCPVLLASVRPL